MGGEGVTVEHPQMWEGLWLEGRVLHLQCGGMRGTLQKAERARRTPRGSRHGRNYCAVVVQLLTSKVPEGHHPRGTTLREALRGNLPLRGLCGGLSEGSAGVSPRVLRGSAGFCGGPRDLPRVFGGSDPMLCDQGTVGLNIVEHN